MFVVVCRSAAVFTVMCYNVLCDKYATRQLYAYCPSWALNWEYRKKGIMEEITSCDADIISLQVKSGSASTPTGPIPFHSMLASCHSFNSLTMAPFYLVWT